MLIVETQIEQDMNRWEKEIYEISKFADKQKTVDRVKIYQDLFALEKEFLKLKSALRILNSYPQDKYELARHKVHEIHKKLKRKFSLSSLVQQICEKGRDLEKSKSWTEVLKLLKNRDGFEQSRYSNKLELKKHAIASLEEVDLSILAFEEWFHKVDYKLSNEQKVEYTRTLNELKFYLKRTKSWLYKLMQCSEEDWDKFLAEFDRSYKNLLTIWEKHQAVFKAKNSISR